jgi:Family of unknown function (DUF6476)
MRGLKSLVIVLGIVLLGGMVTLVAAIVWRGSHPPAPETASSRSPGSAGRPFESSLALPAGAAIASIEAAGERLVVHVVLPDGRHLLTIIDIRSGARLGTIELQPGS